MAGMDAFDRAMDFADSFVDTLAGKAPASSASSRAIAREARIVEAFDAETGAPIFVVTQGGDRAECNSRAFAERVARALRGTP